MTERPTKPVPGKQRITSRSTLGSVGVSVATLIHGFLTTQPGEVVGETVSSFSGNHLIALGVAAAIFAIGYLRDIAMAFIETWGEARGVDFGKAQAQAEEIAEHVPSYPVRTAITNSALLAPAQPPAPATPAPSVETPPAPAQTPPPQTLAGTPAHVDRAGDD